MKGHGCRGLAALCLSLLLKKESINLGDVFVKEVRILNEFLELQDTIEETTSNLSGHFSVNILNGEIDSISDELKLFSTVSDAFKFF